MTNFDPNMKKKISPPKIEAGHVLIDVLIFSGISASNVLIDVLNYHTLKIKYLYNTTVYLIIDITFFSLSYNMY